METINKQECIECLQNLLVANYTMKPIPFRSMEDGLEEIATNRGQGKNRARAGVRQIPSLRKVLMRFLEEIVEERFQNSTTGKDRQDMRTNKYMDRNKGSPKG